MIKQGALVAELQSIVRREHAREPDNERTYAVDGMSPQAFVEPGTYDEVAEVLRFANAERLAVIPRGGGSQIHLANVPSRYDIALSLARLDNVIEHEPADVTVTCQAGIPMLRLQQRLDEAGQMTPFGPSIGLNWTLGGRLAANWSMYHEASGTPRDFTIGLRVVTAAGRIVRTGGKVVKNVAGYDLSKLFIGSYGTLGVIVEASLRLLPMPHEYFGLTFEVASAAQACEMAGAVHSRGLSTVIQTIYNRLPPDERCVWLAWLGGSHRSVQRSRVEITDLATQAGCVSTLYDPHDWEGWPTKTPLLECRAWVLPSRTADLIQVLRTELPPAKFAAEPTAGLVRVSWWMTDNEEDVVVRFRDLASRLGGVCVVTHCSPQLKRQIDVFGPPPPSFPLMRAIKREFDPNNVLSPGRFVGRL